MSDDGDGLPRFAAAILEAPDGPPPIGESRGLGLWMARRAASELKGGVRCATSALGGALVEVVVPAPPARAETERTHAVA